MTDSTIVDNKFLKVLIVTQRAKQIQKGGLPLLEMPGKRATRIALEEVERGLIGFEFMDVTHPPDDLKGINSSGITTEELERSHALKGI